MFTVDLEEYFEVRALREFVPRPEWESLPPRVDRAVDALLERLRKHAAGATFFASRWVTESHPGVIRRIADAGHELAVLGRAPDRDAPQGERFATWREAIRETRERLEEIVDEPVLGYRSSRFTHPVAAEDALTALSEEGFRYDSTLTRRRIRMEFGRDLEGRAFRVYPGEGELALVPPTTARLFGRRVFTAGRTAFRVLPLEVTERTLLRDASPELGGVFCMRSWEMDSAQPTLPVSLASRVRLYWGLEKVDGRLEALLSRLSFDSVRDAVGLSTRMSTAGDSPPPRVGDSKAPRRFKRARG